MCQVYFFAFILFLKKIPFSEPVDPDQMPHYVASDLGLHCLPVTLFRFPGKNGFRVVVFLFLLF